MFQTNTAREIFYIFLWLAGIILLYALVQTFILEPSTDSHTDAHKTHATLDNQTKEQHEKTTTHVKAVAAPINVAKTIKVKEMIKVPTKQTVVAEKPIHEKVIKEVVTTKHMVAPVVTEAVKKISTPTVPTIPKTTISIPTAPSVPSVPSQVVTKEVSIETKKETAHIQKKTELSTETEALKKELTQDEEIELIEKARQLVIEKAEATREEAMKSLHR